MGYARATGDNLYQKGFAQQLGTIPLKSGAAVNTGTLTISGASSLVVASSSRNAIAGPAVESGNSSLAVAAATRKAIAGPVVLTGASSLVVAGMGLVIAIGPIQVGGVSVIFVQLEVPAEPDLGDPWNMLDVPNELDGRAIAGHLAGPLYVRTTLKPWR